MTPSRRWLVLVGVALLCLACKPAERDNDDRDNPVRELIDTAPPLDLTTPTAAETAMQRSHPAVPLQLLFATLFLTDFSAEQSGCPQKTDKSVETTGAIDVVYDAGPAGCTNAAGTADPVDDQLFEGRIEIFGTEGDFQVEIAGFRSSALVDCEGAPRESAIGLDGSLHATSAKAGAEASYRLLMMFDRTSAAAPICAATTERLGIDSTIALAYSGDDTDGDGVPDELIDFDAQTEMATNNLGAWTATGVLQHSTVDEISGGTACTEPRSGTLTLAAGGHDATMRADGASTCTVDACAPWELDGVLQDDEVCGVAACALTPRQPRLPLTLGLLLGGAALAVWRRRRHSSVEEQA